MSWQNYTLYLFSFIALTNHPIITFSFYSAVNWISFDDISIVDQNNTELIINGGFEDDLTGWNFCNPMNSDHSGSIGQAGNSIPHTGLNF